jgi:hypothetical protein
MTAMVPGRRGTGNVGGGGIVSPPDKGTRHSSFPRLIIGGLSRLLCPLVPRD